MKGFTATFRAGFLYLWSQPVPVLILTVFPILLILVLGNALQGYIGGDHQLDTVPVAYVSDAPASPLYAFLTGDVAGSLLRLERCDAEEAAQKFAEGDVEVIIEEKGEAVALQKRSENSRGATMALTLVESFRQMDAAARMAVQRGENPARYMGADVAVSTTTTGGRTFNAIDYYTITMLVMILLYTGLNGSSLFAKNMLDEFGMRLQSCPISRGGLVLGTVAASTAVSFSQGMVTFLFSAFVYGVDWGPRIPLVLLTLFVLVLFSQMLCVFMLLLFRNEGATAGFMQGFVWLTTFVSKGFTVLDFGPMEKVFQFAPNALAQTVLFGAVYGGDEALIVRNLCILVGVILCFAFGAFALGRRRLA